MNTEKSAIWVEKHFESNQSSLISSLCVKTWAHSICVSLVHFVLAICSYFGTFRLENPGAVSKENFSTEWFNAELQQYLKTWIEMVSIGFHIQFLLEPKLSSEHWIHPTFLLSNKNRHQTYTMAYDDIPYNATVQ